jgi:hypothetical protein
MAAQFKISRIITAETARAMMDGSGSFAEIDVSGFDARHNNSGNHGGFAMTVWRMSDAERSPEKEELTRFMVASANACAGINRDYMEKLVADGSNINAEMIARIAKITDMKKRQQDLIDAIKREFTYAPSFGRLSLGVKNLIDNFEAAQ